MNDIVYKSAKGNPVTTSLLVAERFEKNHRDILRTIDNLISSAQNCAQFFYSSSYKDTSGKTNKMFVMTRDGFSLLVMGFTGERALQFKIDFINAFNQMETKLKSIVSLPDFTNPAEAAIAWADQYKQKELAEAKVLHLLPKAEFADRIIDDGLLTDVGQVAKILKLPFGRNLLFKTLRERGVFFKGRNEPCQTYIDRGYFQLREKQIERTNHPAFMVTKVLVTQKGLFWLSKQFGVNIENKFPALNTI